MDSARCKERKRLGKIIQSIAIGADEQNLPQCDPARIKPGLGILKPDMDNGAARANHPRCRSAGSPHADSVNHKIDG